MRGRFLALAAGGALFTSACLAVGARAADPVTINVLLPLTGSGSFLGQGEQTALGVLEKLVNEDGGIGGQPVAFQLVDDQSSAQIAVQLASKLLAANRPTVLLGPALVAECNAVAPLLKSGPVMYCLSAGMHPPTGSFAFSTYISTEDLYRVLARNFRIRGWTKIAVITSTDATGQDAEKGIRAALAEAENSDLKLVADVTFNPTDVTVAAQIQRVKETQPDVLIAWTTGAAVGNVFRALVDLGLKIPVATTTANMTFAQMEQYAHYLPSPLLLPASEWPPHGAEVTLPLEVVAKQEKFFAAFKKAGVRPDGPATYVWDPAMIVIDSLRTLGPNAPAEKVRDYISHLKGYAGINGIYDFPKTPQRGLDQSDTVVTMWDPKAENWTIISRPFGDLADGK